MRATFVCAGSGRRGDPPSLAGSFLRSTQPSAAALRASSWWASASKLLEAASTAARVASATSMASSTRASICSVVTRPSRNAAMRSRTEDLPGAGISKVEPAATPAAWSFEPPQSVTTAPSKPHSSRRISLSRCSFSFAYTPLTRLYELMMVLGADSRTTVSKPER